MRIFRGQQAIDLLGGRIAQWAIIRGRIVGRKNKRKG